jgi:hypothetical protein
VFAFAKNLSDISGKGVSTLFTIGLTQKYAVQLAHGDGHTTYESLWTTYFNTGKDAVSDILPSCDLAKAID